MVAIENMEGSSPNGENEAPKEWARLELHLCPELRDNWLAFAQRLRDRYLNRNTKNARIQQRQTLKQENNSVQEYRQRFEYLCKETGFPRVVWGEEFFKGLIEPLQVKLLGTPHIDITNYELITELSLQYESGYQMQKQIKALNTLGFSKQRPQKFNMHETLFDPKTSASTPHLTKDGKLLQEIKDYRKKNNLCLFDGGNHPTYQCQRLNEKLAKEGKPPPATPSTPTSKSE